MEVLADSLPEAALLEALVLEDSLLALELFVSLFSVLPSLLAALPFALPLRP